jgi:Fe-S-cluster-containing dehydrogenase component
MNRRQFLKNAGATAIGASVLAGASTPASASGGHGPSEDTMGVLVDLTICNGCRRCEAACQNNAGFEAPSASELADRSVFAEPRKLTPTRLTVVDRQKVSGNPGAGESIYVKSNCFHCVDPACVSACIVGALHKDPTGPVTYDAGKCMGCRYCMVACPFEIPTYEYDNVFAPVVRKCTFCADKNGSLNGQVPACVQACPKECLTFGKRSELLARARAKIAESPDVYVDHVYGEHEAGGTSWLYLSSIPFEKAGFLPLDPTAPPRLTETIQHGVFNHFVPPVAWCGLLGLAMALTRPNAAPDPSASQAAAADDAPVTASAKQRQSKSSSGVAA